jgi:hypothetical protein
MSDAGAEIALGNAMDASPTWIDIQDELGVRVSGWRINRGRVDETQRTGTGTASIYVNDRANYLGSGADFPVHGRLLLRGSPRFRGHVDEVNVEVVHDVVAQPEATVGLSRVSIDMVDMFDYLSGVEMQAGVNGDTPPKGAEQYVWYPEGQVDDRMITVLNEAEVPGSLQNVFSGNVELQPFGYSTGTTAMQILDECADAEWPGVSNRFIDSIGRYAFRGRFARFDPTNPTYGIQFWEAGTGANVTTGRAQIRRLSYGTKRKLIVNEALAYVNGAAEDQFVDAYILDATSIAKWGRRSWSAENLLTNRNLASSYNQLTNNGATEALLFATYQVANYKDPVPRVDRVQFKSLRDDDPRAAATWDLMQNAEIGDVIDLYTDWISGRYFIEGMQLEARELDGDIPWAVMDLDLTPAAFWDVDPF